MAYLLENESDHHSQTTDEKQRQLQRLDNIRNLLRVIIVIVMLMIYLLFCWYQKDIDIRNWGSDLQVSFFIVSLVILFTGTLGDANIILSKREL